MSDTARSRSDLPRGALLAAALLAAALGGCTGWIGELPSHAGVDLSCPALGIEPAVVRVATGHGVVLRAAGGSGRALFGLEGADTGGAYVEPGGGLRAGARAAMFTVVARDALCDRAARAMVEVVGPFDVQPAVTRVMPGGSVRYVPSGAIGAVAYSIIAQPDGAGTPAAVSPDGTFTAGTLNGEYVLSAQDTATGAGVSLRVGVGVGAPLRPLAPVLAVPAGARVPLYFRNGGSAASLDATVAGAAGGAVAREGDTLWFDARMARAGAASDVTVHDRFTGEQVGVRVLVGETLGPAPIARGARTGLGALASGDVNGDGVQDLLVGHAERSHAQVESGALLAYYGQPGGAAFAAQPDLVIEGQNALDHFGSTLRVADVDGDHIDDVLVGAPEQDLGVSDRGVMTLYLGARGGLMGTPERVLIGEHANNRFAQALLVTDLTGDGTPELLVGAPGASDPADPYPGCQRGRVYIYRHNASRIVRGVFEAVPWQVLNASDTSTTEGPGAGNCRGNFGGAALAVLDMDGDGNLDLAVGAPRASYPPSPGHYAVGAVLIFRGAGHGMFEQTPAWSLHVAAAEQHYAFGFGAGLEVVRDGAMGAEALLVRTPGGQDGQRGGAWVFAPGSLPPPAPPAMVDGASVPQIVAVTTDAARARYVDPTQHGVGRDAAVGDFDGDGHADVALAAVQPDAPGVVALFRAADIATGSGALAPAAQLTHTGNEMMAARIAALAPAAGAGAGAAAGFAAWAMDRDTDAALFGGAVDYALAGPGPIASRWPARRSLALPAFGAGERAGATVAMGALGGALATVLGAPGMHSAATMTDRAGLHARVGGLFVYPAGQSSATASATLARDDANYGDAPVVLLDFDGDHQLDVAVGDPNELAGVTPAAGFANPDGCLGQDADGNPRESHRGVVRVYAVTPAGLAERFRVWSRRDAPREGDGFGSSLAAADTNGDGRDDLIVGRPGGAGANGFDVVLGRPYSDASGRVVISCNTGDAYAAPFWDGQVRAVYGRAVGGVGDLDGDGCDEIAAQATRRPQMGYRVFTGGVLLVFGYDPTGAHCGGHRTPFTLRLVRDGSRLLDNAAAASGDDAARRAARYDDEQEAGDDDAGWWTETGAVFPVGHGDVTGDGVPDLVFRTTRFQYADYSGPMVEVVSGRYLRGLCPDHACAPGLHGSLWGDGDYNVLAMNLLDRPDRTVIVAQDPLSQQYARALAVGDVDGDGTADVVVGAPDASYGGNFHGVMEVHRGAADLATVNPIGRDPWLVAVGDVTERGRFAASLAQAAGDGAAGRWLVAGAPDSNRAGLGAQVGAAYRWRVEVAR